MLSVEECKTYIGSNLSDEQIKNLRDALYTLVENVVDEYVTSCDKM